MLPSLGNRALAPWPRLSSFRATAIFLAILTASAVQAHDCGPPQLTLLAGESYTWTITADFFETSSQYTPAVTGPAGVALVTPATFFLAKHGVFTITGLTPGTNTLTVNWFYPGTPAGGICSVQINVLPASTNVNAQSVVREGALTSWDGSNSIRARVLRDAIDHYIPAVAKKMFIFTQCYGGSMAFARFRDIPNATVLSATSPNQLASFGGYDDDAARALAPGIGRTARDVHEAGAIGKKTLPPLHGAPPPAKSNDMRSSEWPRVTGDLALTDFSLASVSGGGPIRSRHIVIYAGDPDGAGVRSSIHGDATIPDANGNRTNQVHDASYRDTIKENFRDEPFTTVRSVGGPPDPANPTQGQNGWDLPGSLEGLEAALREAGDAIRNAADPSAEQFILYVTDHGAAGWKAPNPTAPTLPAAAATAAIRGLRIQDPDLAPTIDALRMDPENRCGAILELLGGQNPLGLLPQSLLVPNLQPGDIVLEIHPTNAPVARFTNFNLTPIDFDDDGQIGSVPGEAVQLFFPVAEEQLITLLQSSALDVIIDNQTLTSFTLESFEFNSGAIGKSSSMVPPPWIVRTRRLNPTQVELMVRGIAQYSYAVESSADLVTWQRAPQTYFFADVMTLTASITGDARFYRVVWITP
jgi:hypothetical protein